MASSILTFLSLLPFLLLHNSIPSKASIYQTSNLLKSALLSQPTHIHSHPPVNDTPPTLYFEVTKPIRLPKTKPCSYLVLQHDFGYTYGMPPVLANYSFPSHCSTQKFSKIVFEWKTTCKGRQFDRIFGVWLGGVEILRSCTAEPRATGIVWSVKKDITRYYSLLVKNVPQTLAVYLGNLVDKTYTGVYHVDITVYFYPAEERWNSNMPDWDNSGSLHGSKADLILPIARNLPLNDGLWFEIENITDTESKEFKIPQNVYRAVLEVYLSFHENDETWYSNPPNEYLSANNVTDIPGNGPFREVVVSLDGEMVGAIWPFTVVYTGGVNPLLWRPITGIGSFDLPSYDIEITPFLGNILDGKTHEFGFSVTNALNVWYIDANLHLWLDSKSTNTKGKLLNVDNKPLSVSLVSDFKGLNGTFSTMVRRSIHSSGWVISSHGNITTHFDQDFSYTNNMMMGKDGNSQIVNQIIHFNDTVYKEKLSSYSHSVSSFKNFLLYLYSENLDQGNGSYLSVANVTLGFNEKKSKGAGFGLSSSSLSNLQNGQGVMAVKGNLVVSGLGNTQQIYKDNGKKFCYFRNLSSSNYTILYDKVGNSCDKRLQPRLGFGLNRWWPLPARGTYLSSELLNNSGGV